MRAVWFPIILILFFLFPSMVICQQQRRIDSLEQLLNTDDPGTRAGILTELSWVYHNVNPEKGVRYGKEAVDLLRKSGDRKGESEALLNVGICFYNLDDHEKAIEYFLLSLRIKEDLKDFGGIAATLNNLGNIYKDLGNYEMARDAYQKAYETAEKEGNRKIMSTTLSNIALACKLMSDYEKSLTYNRKALTIRKSIGDKKGWSASLNNIATIYADTSFSGRNLDTALSYINASLKIKEEIDDKYGMSQSFINIGEIYAQRNEYAKAMSYFTKALQIAKEIKATSVQIVCYRDMADLMERQRQFHKAYSYLTLYADLQDSIFKVESSRKIAEMQVKYETGKKEKENELLRQESNIQALQVNKHRNLRNFFIILAILILGLAVAVYSRYLLKKRTNRLLEEKNRQLALLNATKDKFFSIIAHDLKNPFSALLQVSEQLSERYDELNDDQKRRIIRMINDSANLTHNLLENLLEWSVTQTGNLAFQPVSFDIHGLASNAVGLMKLNAEKKGISLALETDEKTLVFADYNMIATVFRNLLTNAIKFMERPGIVRIFSKSQERLVEIGIEDQGIGLSRDDLDKLFRIDVNHAKIGRSKEKGTGLGLILCKEFVEKNGGNIWVYSEPGKGSIFTFTLPKPSEDNQQQSE